MCVDLTKAQLGSTRSVERSVGSEKALCAWVAGFCTDLYFLHIRSLELEHGINCVLSLSCVSLWLQLTDWLIKEHRNGEGRTGGV